MNRHRLLIAAATALAVAGCGTGQVSPNTPPATMRLMSAGPIPMGPQAEVALTVTLTDDDCEMDPARPSIGTGEVEIAFVNASSDRGSFELLRIADGHTYRELDEYIQGESDRIAAGGEPLGPPPWVTTPVDREPPAGITVSVRTTLAVGTHAIVCARVDPAAGRVIAGPYLVGPLGGG
jgi:hypothetical protein